jgi:hypothetical protein
VVWKRKTFMARPHYIEQLWGWCRQICRVAGRKCCSVIVVME